MKCLYLTFSNQKEKAGLFYSTHDRIRQSTQFLEEYKVFNIQFYDSWFLTILKTILRITPRKKDQLSFILDKIEYENIWLKRGLFSAMTPWGKFDKWRNFRIIFNEKFSSEKNIQKILKKANHYDYIMAHWGYPNGKIAMEIAKKTRKPYFVTYHGSDINIISQKNRSLKKVNKEVLKNASMNFLVSQKLYNKVKKIDSSLKTYVSPNGIMESIIKKKKFNSGEIINILFIGNLIDIKRADKLPEIIKAIVTKSNQKLTFSIIGKGEYENSIKKNLEYSNISVSMYGQLPREIVLKHLENATILILPSRNEGLPLVILEAIAKGIIPVASNVGGISEVLEKEFLVNESKSFINDFAKKVVKLVYEPKYPKLKIEEYTWEYLIRNEMKIIKQNINVK